MALTENNRWMVVEGPMKIERVHVTSDGTDADTLSTRLQRAITVQISDVNANLSATADPASVTLSGKVATVNDPGAIDYIVTFIGF